ncbi:hypothetical protein SKAU_G00077010 [Synaphobranchus kaupii]|uniref:Ig-like domain-containing protein n=1 Tax=Synaphobranchus kaupii TaxID=118154 RepID=A0A9Q1G8T1_SYNKA|nr:hypothetical protein SKAU_G00077010 [Synaphobranchus kaupii]
MSEAGRLTESQGRFQNSAAMCVQTGRWFCEGRELHHCPDIQISRHEDLHTLVITEAFEDDTGRYTCVASNYLGADNTSAEVYIEGASSSDSEGEGSGQKTRPGAMPQVQKKTSSVSLTIRSSSPKSPEATPHRSTLVQPLSAPPLRVQSPLSSLPGGEGQYIAPPVFTKHLQDAWASEGQVVVLECRVRGSPPVRVRWYRQGQEIQDSPDFRVLQKKPRSAAEPEEICTLVIAETFPEDGGQFSCTANNHYGTVTSTAQLTVHSGKLTIHSGKLTVHSGELTAEAVAQPQTDSEPALEREPETSHMGEEVQADPEVSESNSSQLAKEGSSSSEEDNEVPGGEQCKVSEEHSSSGQHVNVRNDGERACAAADNVAGEESEEEGVAFLLTGEAGEMALEDDGMSDISDMSYSQGSEGNLYSFEQINKFLDETKGRGVTLDDFFPDLDKFVASALSVQRRVGFDALSKQKRFRLKKYVTAIRNDKRSEKFKLRK